MKGPSGPRRSVSETSGRKLKQRRRRRSVSEAACPAGAVALATGGRQTKASGLRYFHDFTEIPYRIVKAVIPRTNLIKSINKDIKS